MTKIKLKKKLKERIDSIDDELILEVMLQLTEVEKENLESYQLSDEQLNAVKEAEKEYERGEFISGEQADKMIREWLGK